MVELRNVPLKAIICSKGQLMIADCYQNVWWECNKHFCNPTKNEQKFYKSTQYHVHSNKNGLVLKKWLLKMMLILAAKTILASLGVLEEHIRSVLNKTSKLWYQLLKGWSSCCIVQYGLIKHFPFWKQHGVVAKENIMQKLWKMCPKNEQITLFGIDFAPMWDK